MKAKKDMASGDIFTIPLFLPSYQEWTKMEQLIDYKRYQFREDDIYAFGGLIELQTGNMNLIEIFSYVGKIPETPEAIIYSGRFFEPVMMAGAFSKGHWQIFLKPGGKSSE